MRRARTGRAGFTLLELMIVVAIIGILATIAIPSFQKVQLRSKIGEGRTNLAAIRTSEEAYYAEFGTYLGAMAAPAAVPGSQKATWPVGTDFERIGWKPEGTVQFQYQVAVPPGVALVYTAEAISDLDGDGAQSTFGYVRRHPAGGAEIAGTVCPDTGVWDPVAGLSALLSIVGPCDAVSGLSVF